MEYATPVRLLFQQRGPESSRRHMVRVVVRLALLAAADVAAFVFLRAIIRLVRDIEWLGPGIAHAVGAVFPYGLLGGTNFGVALIVGLMAFGAYGRGDARRDPEAITKGVAFAVLVALWPSFWSEAKLLVLAQGLIMLAIISTTIVVERAWFDRFVRFLFQKPADGGPMVFVGDRADPEAQRVFESLAAPDRTRATTWVNVPHDDRQSVSPTWLIERLHDALSANEADTLVLCGDFPPPVLEAIVETATSGGLRVLAVARVSGVVQRRTRTVQYDGTPFVELTVPGFRGWQLAAKRALDLAGALVGLVLLSPLFALIAIAIKLDSPGSVLFRQERVGYAGKVFRVFKFRTMRTTAEEEKAELAHLNASGDQRLFKIPNDPRITKLGRFLRKYSLDELPQLLNVLKGEMSLVGPRPFFESDLKTYLDHHFARLGAKPGITGLWQVKGRSTVTDFEEVVRLDREYIEHWSVRLDVEILLQTIPVVLRGRGAY